MGNDDLDWLYRREPTSDPTVVMPNQTQPDIYRDSPRPSQSGYPPAYPGQPASARQHAGQSLPPAKPSRLRRSRRRRPIRRFVVFIIVAWLAFMVGTPVYAWTQLTTIDTTPKGERPAHQPGTLILLVGSDARDQLTEKQRGELGTGNTAGRRTDTMMLLYTPPSGRPALISLPRDSYLLIPGHGRNKLNAAYAIGGAPLLVQTVEQATGLRLDGYLEVGFLGIVEMVEAVGGVEVCLPKPISDRDSHLDLPAGCQTLDGRNALGYVRMRKADPLGDIGRMNRQREIIGTITKKALHPAQLLNPIRYYRLNMAAARTLTRGEDTGITELVSAGLAFRAISAGQGMTMTVPIANANASTSAGSSMLWDEAAATKMFSVIAAGRTDGLEKYAK